jgi:hypothetical protein
VIGPQACRVQAADLVERDVTGRRDGYHLEGVITEMRLQGVRNSLFIPNNEDLKSRHSLFSVSTFPGFFIPRLLEGRDGKPQTPAV